MRLQAASAEDANRCCLSIGREERAKAQNLGDEMTTVNVKRRNKIFAIEALK
jgi:hypothetical protein